MVDETVEMQKDYYKTSALSYDEMHLSSKDEHYFSLHFILGMLDFLEVKSILDVGSGTGRALNFIKQERPDITIVGVEPVKELREIGYEKGLSKDELVDGDGSSLIYADGEFDLVCEFGMLHHVKNPVPVVNEMLRVSRKAIFISDYNIYGDGSFAGRLSKQIFKALGLWKIAAFLKTKGKGYIQSEIDGIAYYYSVFDSFHQINNSCSSVHYVNTNIQTGASMNLYRSASHIGLLGIKD